MNLARDWGLNTAKCDSAGNRARPCAYRAAVVATVDDPMAIRRPPGDDTNMVGPNNHHPNPRTPGIRAFSSPLSRKSKSAVGFSEVTAHVDPAPGVRPVHVMMSVTGASIGVRGKCAHQSCRNGD